MDSLRDVEQMPKVSVSISADQGPIRSKMKSKSKMYPLLCPIEETVLLRVETWIKICLYDNCHFTLEVKYVGL